MFKLVTSTADGQVTKYAYDAAGRLVKEGEKVYSYGWLDKIVNVQENGTMLASFDYHMNGQIAATTRNGKTENFFWDGLALIHRDGTNYVNEPYITGGNPILADNKVLFNDMLGTTLGSKEGEKFSPIQRDAFGMLSSEQSAKSESSDNFFTGKPFIGELGYAFLFRNYRAEQGKWQSADPLGYPDGWNNLAYVNNQVSNGIDIYGLQSFWQWSKETLASLSYGILYIFNGIPSTKYYFAPGSLPTAITSLYTASVVKNIDSVVRAIDSYCTSAISHYNNKSSTGTFSLTSSSTYISNSKNTAWGAIVGTSTLTISGTATVTAASDGGRDVARSLSCRFFDEIDWKSYEELLDEYQSFENWPITDYIEGALDVWLDNGLKANYNIDVSWTKNYSKHFPE